MTLYVVCRFHSPLTWNNFTHNKRTHPEFVYHTFPEDNESCLKWREAIPSLATKTVEYLHGHFHICSNHFSSKNYISKITLRTDACPDQNLTQKEPSMEINEGRITTSDPGLTCCKVEEEAFREELLIKDEPEHEIDMEISGISITLDSNGKQEVPADSSSENRKEDPLGMVIKEGHPVDIDYELKWLIKEESFEEEPLDERPMGMSRILNKNSPIDSSGLNDMKPSTFYSKRYEAGVPEESEDENLDSEDDDYEPEIDQQAHDDEDSDDITDNEESEEEEVPGTSSKGKPDIRRNIWKTKKANDVGSLEKTFLGQVYAGDGAVKSPIEYFEELFDSNMKEWLVGESNKYAVQIDTNKPLNLTVNELEQFFGMLYIMSIVKLPKARLYWSSYLRFPKVADVMPLQRFETIKKNLHCNDNQSRPDGCTDKLYKIRPLLDMINSKVSNTLPGEKLSIDEQIVPFKGRSSIRTYNRKNPKKWGYKIFVLSGIDGLVYNFNIYTGSINPVPGQPDVKASGNIVLDLLQPIPRGVWHKVYFDNWFNSPLLQVTLWKQGFCSLGTVRLNRVSGCQMPSDAQMKKSGRGISIIRVTEMDDVELRVVKWHDNRGVTLLSNFAAVEPQSTVKRWDSKRKKYMEIECPSIVMICNKFMGGVDLLESLLALYRITLRSKKWYHKLLWHFLDMLLIQAWLLYIRDFNLTDLPRKKKLSLLMFKLEVADCLLQKGKTIGTKRGRSSADVDELYKAKAKKGPTVKIPAKPIRTDQFGHFPEFGNKRGRCKNPGCTGTCKVFCCKCKVNLCFTPKSNCFMKFHE